jgi:hypothetical protein
MKYSDEVLHAMKFTGGEGYYSQRTIWQVMQRIHSGNNFGTGVFEMKCIE